MTTATHPAATSSSTETSSKGRTKAGPIVRTGALAGFIASALNMAVVAAAMGIDVPMEAEGEPFPLLGIAQVTLMCTALGLILAVAFNRRAKSPQHTFVVTAVVLTVISLVPPFLLDATLATQVVLEITHVAAAAVVIPAVASRLPVSR